MRITIERGSYNQRRYSKPWIARVTSWEKKPELAWGEYHGDDNGGTLEITAEPGDIIRWGQKDYRGNGGRNEWVIVTDDGEPHTVSQASARERWVSTKAKVT